DEDEDTPLVGGTTYEDSHHFGGRALSFEPIRMPAAGEHDAVYDALMEALDLDPDSDAAYYAIEELAEGRPPVWVGGWPHSVQEIEANETDAVLLQIGNGDDGDFMWGGDIGCASFLISREDLAARRFERVRYGSAGY
ncbi:MAG: DUF1963 domain-containing protein, partial [Pseudomonadota bacterium]